MKRIVTKEQENKFGKIIGGQEEFLKTLYGKVLYVDHFGAVFFVDNDDIGHYFKVNQVKSFEECEFKDKSK